MKMLQQLNNKYVAFTVVMTSHVIYVARETCSLNTVSPTRKVLSSYTDIYCETLVSFCVGFSNDEVKYTVQICWEHFSVTDCRLSGSQDRSMLLSSATRTTSNWQYCWSLDSSINIPSTYQMVRLQTGSGGHPAF